MARDIRAYFISDLHLTSPEDARAQALLKFLRALSGPSGDHAPDITHLFLLGDIFDLWIARHGYFLEKWVDINAEFLRLRQRGVEIHYLEGNHDLYLEHYFGNHLGFYVHGDPIHLSVGPWRLRLEHGDQMDPSDRGYRFLRWLLRTPVLRWVGKNLPEQAIVRLGQRMSHMSRDYTSNRKTITEAVAREKIRTHAQKVLQEAEFDLLIAGHVHVRDEHRIEAGGRTATVINLGSWLDQPVAYRLTAAGGEFVALGDGIPRH